MHRTTNNRFAALHPYMSDGGPGGVEGYIERPGRRLAEHFVVYGEPHRIPVVFAHVKDGLPDNKRHDEIKT